MEYRRFLGQRNYSVYYNGRYMSYISKTIEYMIPRVNPNVNYGFGVTIMCLCRFIDCKKCITLVQDVANGRGCGVVG